MTTEQLGDRKTPLAALIAYERGQEMQDENPSALGEEPDYDHVGNIFADGAAI